jgi:hypothetical protein
MKNVKQNTKTSFIAGALLLMSHGSVLAEGSGAGRRPFSLFEGLWRRGGGEKAQKLNDEKDGAKTSVKCEKYVTFAPLPSSEPRNLEMFGHDFAGTAASQDKRKKYVTFAPSCFQSSPEPRKLRRISKKNMTETMRRLQSYRAISKQMSDTRKGHPLALLLQKAMGILNPGDPWNFVRRPSLKTLLPAEEIQRKSLKIWRNYTLDECIKQLQDAETIFNFFHANEQLSEDARYSYGVRAAIVGIYRWGFETLRGEYDPVAVRTEVENWFQRNGYRQQNGSDFFAIEVAFQTAVKRAIAESKMEIANKSQTGIASKEIFSLFFT